MVFAGIIVREFVPMATYAYVTVSSGSIMKKGMTASNTTNQEIPARSPSVFIGKMSAILTRPSHRPTLRNHKTLAPAAKVSHIRTYRGCTWPGKGSKVASTDLMTHACGRRISAQMACQPDRGGHGEKGNSTAILKMSTRTFWLVSSPARSVEETWRPSRGIPTVSRSPA